VSVPSTDIEAIRQREFEAQQAAEAAAGATTTTTGYEIPQDVLDIIAAATAGTKPEDPDKVRAERIYYEVWGRLPPKNWWESVQHLSDFEIHDQLLSGGEGVRRTQYWRDKGAEYADVISRAMGRRTG